MAKKEGATKDVGTILVSGKYISQEDLDASRKRARTQRSPVEDILIQEGIITPDLLGQALAESFGVPYADLNSHIPTKALLGMIPEEIAQKWRVMVFRAHENEVTVTTDRPNTKGLPALLARGLKGKNVRIAYSLTRDIDAVLSRHRKSLDSRLSSYQGQGGVPAPVIVDEVFADAISLRASDIHLEPLQNGFLVRFRVDGVMQEAATLHKELHAIVVNRIKVLARMRLDEHHAAQDGAIRYQAKNDRVDVRVSIVPTLEGEKVVMRLLTGAARTLTMTDLGLSEANQQLLETAIHKPFGMLLTSGPTGSGKTTTLYGALKALDRGALNITTIEDPVEYRLTGINQIPVNEHLGLTFEKGLRSIVRQDPDVILVGEIRDRETAEISVNAALTGHLLFSTFHANDAATAVVRLMEIGVQPFLLSSTLELLIAQRLVRRICESCRVSRVYKKPDIAAIAPGAEKVLSGRTVRLYEGKGCNECSGVGYRGRIGIFEVIPVTQEMRDLILKSPAASQVWAQARKEGAKSMFEDGIDKTRQGITTLEEVARVASVAL